MKLLSNKTFNKVVNMMANAPIATERLPIILDADKDESIDAYFFGRLVGFNIKDKDALQALIERRIQICSKEELQSVEIRDVKIVSVGKIEILYMYTYTHKDENSSPMQDNASCTFLATDDEIDGIFDFVYKD